MASFDPKQPGAAPSRPAASTERRHRHHPSTTSALIADSPRMAAQRQEIRAVFGMPAQQVGSARAGGVARVPSHHSLPAAAAPAHRSMASALQPASPAWPTAHGAVQLAAILTTSDQSYDKTGAHISQGQTDPPNLVNTLNRYADVITDKSGTEYKNAHMMAATFGGGNGLENIVAWNADMETGWSQAEDKVRGAEPGNMPKPRPKERGTVTTTVNLPGDWSADSMAEQIFDNAEDEVTNPANWLPVPGAPAGAPPTVNRLKYDADLRTPFVNRVRNQIGAALARMPDSAKIAYESTEPDDKRKFKVAFTDRSAIADPEVSDDAAACLTKISSLNVLPAVDAHRLRTDL